MANRNPAELSGFGTQRPFRFHHRKSYAGSRGVVPGGLTTWFPEYLSIWRRVDAETGGILETGNQPPVSRNEAIVQPPFRKHRPFRLRSAHPGVAER